MVQTVKAVANLAGVSVRTLHHYDHIGLLKPTSVSASGYRQYTARDLERLQQILFFRELGFGLEEINEIIDSPGFDKKQAMIAHKEILLEKKRRLERLIQSVDLTIDAMNKGVPMDSNSMFDGFDESKIEEHRLRYRDEAIERYGKEAIESSEARTSKYTKEDWATIQAEMGDIYQALAGMMDRDPSDTEVQEQVGRWYTMINERFYDCTPEIFRGLGDLYVDDSRFTENIDRTRLGLAAYMRAAMHVYADRLTAAG